MQYAVLAGVLAAVVIAVPIPDQAPLVPEDVDKNNNTEKIHIDGAVITLNYDTLTFDFTELGDKEDVGWRFMEILLWKGYDLDVKTTPPDPSSKSKLNKLHSAIVKSYKPRLYGYDSEGNPLYVNDVLLPKKSANSQKEPHVIFVVNGTLEAEDVLKDETLDNNPLKENLPEQQEHKQLQKEESVTKAIEMLSNESSMTEIPSENNSFEVNNSTQGLPPEGKPSIEAEVIDDTILSEISSTDETMDGISQQIPKEERV